jgi:hypothetical protein
MVGLSLVGMPMNLKGFDDGVASDIGNGGAGNFRNIGIWFGFMFSSHHVAVMVDWLSHTCSLVGGENPYTLRVSVKMSKVVMFPQISALYELTSSMRPSVAPYPSMIMLSSIVAMRYPWNPWKWRTVSGLRD